MKKIKLKHIIVFLVVWNLVFGSILYLVYMNRVERLFGTVKKDVLKSEILKEEIDVVKKAKFKNFMQWISVVDGKECIKMQVITEENDKHNICTIIEIIEDDVIVKGYIVKGEILYDSQ